MPVKEPSPHHIGRQLAKYRRARHLTQAQVGEHLQISGEAVSRLERGEVELTESKLLKLADLYGCPADELLLAISPRPQDQGQQITSIIKELGEADKQFALEFLQTLANHLAQRK
ncbi:helix-turn-helix domain-containing protein [Pseudomonas guariconensis]|uniref:helix-turn-helix domain-containing protein n=1 Tax=Pseudomonas guariconensis TaxID=1288410 RepID=UPI0018AA2B06|nr:helix-turn-helix transcriptional regulator [Pseudomonas guariconensis]MBF8740702.1 helix-turn-helix transcriptional regulator [Pseudomonas guariconensis]MBF8749882.1 helix-turn-helix transcriptional regulator [Pseudomonas guariconensis]